MIFEKRFFNLTMSDNFYSYRMTPYGLYIQKKKHNVFWFFFANSTSLYIACDTLMVGSYVTIDYLTINKKKKSFQISVS